MEISLRIGQRVRHTDYKGQRVTGVVTGLQVDSDRALIADVVLDKAIVIPADAHGPEITVRHQHAPAHEFSPFDERDELMAEILAALNAALDDVDAARAEGIEQPAWADPARTVVAKVTGAAS